MARGSPGCWIPRLVFHQEFCYHQTISAQSDYSYKYLTQIKSHQIYSGFINDGRPGWLEWMECPPVLVAAGFLDWFFSLHTTSWYGGRVTGRAVVNSW